MSIGKRLGMPAGRTYEENRILALQKCNTGLEFEAENVKNRLVIDDEEAGFWVEKEDGSLRGSSMEYVLREPLFGNDLVRAVKWLCAWGTKERLESNYRTGLHVHIDVRNLEEDELISMLIYYALFEKVIFDWVGDEREGSIFCMPFYKAEGALKTILEAINSKHNMKEVAKKIDRYSAFNLNSLSKFGTVEWRHLRTTFNEERVIDWINVAQGFKRYVKNNALKPQELMQEFSSRGAPAIFAGIVGPSLASKIWTQHSEALVKSVGIPVAQEIAVLLNGSEGIAWDSVRSALGTGENPRWKKWAEKAVKDSKLVTKFPENPFAEPELMRDLEFQKEAIEQLRESLKVVLSNPIPASGG